MLKVWLLKRFLYKPVLTAMSNRQQRIEDELKLAATLAESAEKERVHYLRLQEEAKAQGKKELLQAHQDADELREGLFRKVEADAVAAHIHWQDELAHEKSLFLKQASEQVAGQLHNLAQRIFSDLADENFEERIVSRFCALISNPETEREFFQQLQNSNELHVSTAFPLSSSLQEKIQEVLTLRIGSLTQVQFQKEPTLIVGVLLSSNGHQMKWNIHQYLDDFQEELKKGLFKDKP